MDRLLIILLFVFILANFWVVLEIRDKVTLLKERVSEMEEWLIRKGIVPPNH